MGCKAIMDRVYAAGDDPQAVPLPARIRIGLHLLFCRDCARATDRFEECRDILHNDYFPSAPDLENSVMAMIDAGESEVPQEEIAGGFSTRGWIIAGLVMFISLATAFFGLEFNKMAVTAGISFLIPVGITIGIVLTCYGALFIGSHLKELTARFGL